MRAVLVVLSSLVFAVLPAASASASGGGPGDPFIVGCEGPSVPCTNPEGQRVCILFNGNAFCFDIWP